MDLNGALSSVQSTNPQCHGKKLCRLSVGKETRLDTRGKCNQQSFAIRPEYIFGDTCNLWPSLKSSMLCFELLQLQWGTTNAITISWISSGIDSWLHTRDNKTTHLYILFAYCLVKKHAPAFRVLFSCLDISSSPSPASQWHSQEAQRVDWYTSQPHGRHQDSHHPTIQ